jgi:hypothetical protein
MLGTIAKKYIKTTAKKEASKKASRKAAEKNVGKEAADVTKPADTSPLGREYKGTQSEATPLQQAGGRRAGGQRAYNAAKKEKAKLEKEVSELSSSSLSAKEKFEKLRSLKEQIKLLDERMEGKKGLAKRYAIERKSGGSMKVKSYKKGGKIGRGCGAALRGGGKVMK